MQNIVPSTSAAENTQDIYKTEKSINNLKWNNGNNKLFLQLPFHDVITTHRNWPRRCVLPHKTGLTD